MHKHKRRSEGVLFKAPNTRSRLHTEVRDELAGTETFLTDTQGLKLAYKTHQTKRYKDVDKFIQDGFIEIDGKLLEFESLML